MNKIIFLGTGGGRFTTAHQTRATGGIVIILNNLQIHLDPGPGALVQANKNDIDPTQTDLVLVSHNDIDHVNDINCLLDAMTYGGIKKRGSLISTKSVIEGNPEEPQYVTNFHKSHLEKIKPLKPQEKIKINNITIEALKTKHRHEDGVGFKIYSEDAVITYASDTEYQPTIADQYKNSDILILNIMHPNNKKIKGHLCSKEAIEIINRAKPKLTILTHFGRTMLEANPLYEARNIANETKQHVIAATDGLEIDLKDYSAESKQKTLSKF